MPKKGNFVVREKIAGGGKGKTAGCLGEKAPTWLGGEKGKIRGTPSKGDVHREYLCKREGHLKVIRKEGKKTQTEKTGKGPSEGMGS